MSPTAKTKSRAKAKAKPRPKRPAPKVKARPSKQQLAAKIARLCAAARKLGTITGVVMPIDELRLGVKLSEQPRPTVIPSLLALSEDANMHARRVAFTALRHMQAWNDSRVFDAFLRGMSDPKGWVRYLAAWALGDSRTTDPRALAALEALAQGARPDYNISDGEASAAARAAESLASLRQIS
jgi:hypothetical protein